MEHCFVAAEYKLLKTDRVPFVAGDDYLNVPFLEYHRQSVELNHLERLITDSFLANRIFQTWYFFSFLQELLGSFYDHSDYVTTEENQYGQKFTFVTTHRLDSRLRQWVNNVKQHSDEYIHLKVHLKTCYALMSQTGLHKFHSINRLVQQSALSCIETTTAAVRDAFGELDLSIPTCFRVPRSSDIDNMSVYGRWCPQLASKTLQSTLHMQSVVLLRTLKMASPKHNHNSCTKTHCVHVPNDPGADCEPDHIRQGCVCKMGSITGDALDIILDANDWSFPIIQAKISIFGKVKFKIVNYEPGLTYFAISHVWSDGLGNSRANGLYKCQLEALVKQVQKLSHKSHGFKATRIIHLWLDTICCPVSPLPAKLKALSRIKDVYRQAAGVIVLDSAILSRSFSESDFLECVLLAFSSRWMFRVWTLQEALLSNRLFFCFSNTIIELNWLLDKLVYGMQTAPYNQFRIHLDLYLKIDQIRRFTGRSSKVHPRYTLSNLSAAMEHRTLTVPSDEPLCLASIMDFDVSIKEKIPGLRMSRFWKVMADRDGIRSNIIFNHFPRLQIQGYRWAPATILRDRSTKIHNRYPFIDDCSRGMPARASPLGLVVHYSGYLLKTNMPRISDTLYDAHACKTILELATSFKYGFFHIRDSVRSDQWYRVMLDPWHRKQLDSVAANTRCALIARNGLYNKSLDALVVMVDEEDDHAIFVRSVGVCGIYPYRKRDSQLLTMMAEQDSFTDIRDELRKDADAGTGLLYSLGGRSREGRDELIDIVDMTIRYGLYFTISGHLPVRQRWIVD